jgi:predicted nucleotidyltransferase
MSADHPIPAVQHIADQFAQFPQVIAVALAGSLTGGSGDAHSDFDLYIYSDSGVPSADRARIARELADPAYPIEIDNPYWGTEDAWTERTSGTKADLIFWSPEWIEDQVDRVLVRHEAWVGYSTCFWHTVLHSVPYFDRDGWFTALKRRADQPYPDALRRDVLVKNYPVLRQAVPSYRNQIELAIRRRDRISLNHRIAALLASYFDVLFAVNRVPNPGEKRLIERTQRLCSTLPDGWDQHVEAVLCSAAQPWESVDTLSRVDALIDALDRLLIAEKLITPGGHLEKDTTT